jgi:hypothetical protein
VRAQVHCMFGHIKDWAAVAIENVDLFFSPKILFNICDRDRHRHTFRVHIHG